MATDVVTMDKVVALCKRRGFIFPASEIYGGVAHTYDYRHYGVVLKNNVVAQWWKAMIQERDDIVALDSAIIQHPRTWEASGHLAGFTDPLVQCLGKCKQRFREDHLRPETAQGIFLDFKQTLQYSRKKPPFGIAQVGKSFRNEITPGNFVFRTLEFEQMEMEFFVPPDEAPRWHQYWMDARMDWYVGLGIERDSLRLRPHGADELSHYSSATSDIEYLYPIGWSELEGIANRGDFDLRQHQEHSGAKLEFKDQGVAYVPHVIEPAAGVGRTVLALLCDAYDEDDIGGEQRTVLRLAPHMAPVKLAVLPLVNKDGQPEKARAIYEELRGRWPVEYDTGGSIGKRYRRQDEIGTPWGVTVDHQTMEDGTVTLRDRDTLDQTRYPADELPALLSERLAAPWTSPKCSA